MEPDNKTSQPKSEEWISITRCEKVHDTVFRGVKNDQYRATR